MILGQLDSHMQKIRLDSFLIPYTKIKSKWLKYLNVRANSVRLLRENAGANLRDLGF